MPKSETGHQRQAQIAHFRFSPDSGHIAESHRSATKSAEARRLAVNFAKLLGLLRRSPPRSQPQIHDGPRNARLDPNSRRVMGHHRTHACSRVDDKKQCEPHQLH